MSANRMASTTRCPLLSMKVCGCSLPPGLKVVQAVLMISCTHASASRGRNSPTAGTVCEAMATVRDSRALVQSVSGVVRTTHAPLPGIRASQEHSQERLRCCNTVLQTRANEQLQFGPPFSRTSSWPAGFEGPGVPPRKHGRIAPSASSGMAAALRRGAHCQSIEY